MDTRANTLAIHGGDPAVPYKLPVYGDITGRDMGEEEIRGLVEVVESGNLGYIGGVKIKEFQQMWIDRFGVEVAVCVSSGTAALHTAINFLNLGPGDEVIVPAITDIGSVLGVMLQGATPVFCDVEPVVQCMDPEDMERKITPRTRAVMPVHLYGYPCDMDRIMEIAARRNLYVVEDCAQAHTTTYKGKPVGTFGDVACYSFQQSKHMTTGDGGMVMAKRDRLCGRKLVHCHDKAWPREVYRDHLFLAPNYHFTDLQAAVGIAQLRKLDRLVEARRRSALRLTGLLSGIDGVYPQGDTPRGTHTFFAYPIPYDGSRFTADNRTIAQALTAEGVACAPGYLPHPIYGYDVVAKAYDVQPDLCPVAVEACNNMLYLSWTEKHTLQHAEDIFTAVKKVLGYYAR